MIRQANIETISDCYGFTKTVEVAKARQAWSLNNSEIIWLRVWNGNQNKSRPHRIISDGNVCEVAKLKWMCFSKKNKSENVATRLICLATVQLFLACLVNAAYKIEKKNRSKSLLQKNVKEALLCSKLRRMKLFFNINFQRNQFSAKKPCFFQQSLTSHNNEISAVTSLWKSIWRKSERKN